MMRRSNFVSSIAARFNNNNSSLLTSGMKKGLAGLMVGGHVGGSTSMFSPLTSSVLQARAVATYADRHIGPDKIETQQMLETVGYPSFDAMVKDIIPDDIRRPEMEPVDAMSEQEALAHLRSLMTRNKTIKSCIGQGYYEANVPPAILRNVLENPAWYTPYTPYQAEISQGRLESLLNYQTMIRELTGVEYANASLLDEATAAFEAVNLANGHHRRKRNVVYVSNTCFTSSIEMIRSRAKPLGIQVEVKDPKEFDMSPDHLKKNVCAVVVQTPDSTGAMHDYTDLFKNAKASGVVSCCATDLMAATVTKSVGEMGADVAFGNAQRFGIPLGYGGPHPAFFAVHDTFKRLLPGRLIGISKDATGKEVYRMTLQTREQHIRREKATSNVCTAQALLANMAAFYGVYHGPDGLSSIATKIHTNAKSLAIGLQAGGHTILTEKFFDTITVKLGENLNAEVYDERCVDRGININVVDEEAGILSISVDEATTAAHIAALLEAAGVENPDVVSLQKVAANQDLLSSSGLQREAGTFMNQKVFHKYRSETELMRYCYKLQRKDYGLGDGMVPLGSCTMKLNAAATMLPMSWPEVGNIHPHAPVDQTAGYQQMFVLLKSRLRAITGLAACSLQPNSGAQGEYAGLRCITAYHQSKGEGHRNICLLPISAHGTNPASSQLAGLTPVNIKCDSLGRIDLEDLDKNIEKHGKNLAACMITYPSTYGLFDKDIKTVTSKIHEAGGQVYIDGANLNAMVGYTGPGFFGGDVCHINMHKTFSIPHGGGGPGMGPICVKEHLTPFLPNSTFGPEDGGSKPFGQVSQAPFGSASILNISYLEIAMLGSEGLKKSTDYAILCANYLLTKLEPHFPVLYKGETGRCAHEFIIDLRSFKQSAGLEAEDIAKRLMDYGFHAPTLAFPVAGTLMVEPTESEDKAEMDRFVDAMISIRAEIRAIEEGKADKGNNLLVNSPHTAEMVSADTWDKPYTRTEAAYPLPSIRENKFWPSIARVDGAYGDRNLFCACKE